MKDSSCIDQKQWIYLDVFDFIMIDFANKTASSWLIITAIRCHSLNNVFKVRISAHTIATNCVVFHVLNSRFSTLKSYVQQLYTIRT